MRKMLAGLGIVAALLVSQTMVADPAEAKQCGGGKTRIPNVSGKICITKNPPNAGGGYGHAVLSNSASGTRGVTINYRISTSDRGSDDKPVKWHSGAWERMSRDVPPGDAWVQLAHAPLADCLKVEMYLSKSGVSGRTISNYSCQIIA